jgi:hypothetical protein
VLAQTTLAQKLTMMHQGASCDWGACVASALIVDRTAIGPWEEFDLIND